MYVRDRLIECLQHLRMSAAGYVVPQVCFRTALAIKKCLSFLRLTSHSRAARLIAPMRQYAKARSPVSFRRIILPLVHDVGSERISLARMRTALVSDVSGFVSILNAILLLEELMAPAVRLTPAVALHLYPFLRATRAIRPIDALGDNAFETTLLPLVGEPLRI